MRRRRSPGGRPSYMPTPAEMAERKKINDEAHRLAHANDQGLTDKGRDFLYEALRWKLGTRSKRPEMTGRRSVVEPVEEMLIERAARLVAERGSEL